MLAVKLWHVIILDKDSSVIIDTTKNDGRLIICTYLTKLFDYLLNYMLDYSILAVANSINLMADSTAGVTKDILGRIDGGSYYTM